MHPEHLKTFEYCGLYRYFLTFCTFERRKHFVQREHVDLVMAQIRRAARERCFAISAYCVMPDHVHLLIEAESDRADARRFIRSAKQYSGYHFKQQFGRQLWQRYGYERVLRSEQETLGVARYIVDSPRRAGLVEDVQDYPHSGSDQYTLTQILEAVAIDPRWSG